jgi:phage-related protein
MSIARRITPAFSQRPPVSCVSGAAYARQTVSPPSKRRWRHYETAAHRRPVLEFIRKLSDGDKAAILAAMKEVRREGVRAARHVGDEIFEVRADGDHAIYRILFAREGTRSQVLLALVAFKKKTQRTPPAEIALACRRLSDWRSRGRAAVQSSGHRQRSSGYL